MWKLYCHDVLINQIVVFQYLYILRNGLSICHEQYSLCSIIDIMCVTRIGNCYFICRTQCNMHYKVIPTYGSPHGLEVE